MSFVEILVIVATGITAIYGAVRLIYGTAIAVRSLISNNWKEIAGVISAVTCYYITMLTEPGAVFLIWPIVIGAAITLTLDIFTSAEGDK